MGAYLIHGLSGTGKTTIGHELERRGYHVINTDEEFGYYGHIQTGAEVDFPGHSVTEDWYKNNGWLWKRSNVEKALAQSLKEPLFLCGGALNQEDFYPAFVKIFLLTVDRETFKKRINNRGLDPHTNNSIFIQKELKHIAGAEKYAEQYGMVLINTSIATVSEATDQILCHVDKS